MTTSKEQFHLMNPVVETKKAKEGINTSSTIYNVHHRPTLHNNQRASMRRYFTKYINLVTKDIRVFK